MAGCIGQKWNLLLGFHAFKWAIPEGSMNHVASWSYIQLPNPNKSIDSRESGERRNQSPGLGCPPSQQYSQPGTTKAQPSFATSTGKGNTPIPSIILLSRSFITQFRCHLPYALRATEFWTGSSFVLLLELSGDKGASPSRSCRNNKHLRPCEMPQVKQISKGTPSNIPFFYFLVFSGKK